jgi:hypothetical protein
MLACIRQLPPCHVFLGVDLIGKEALLVALAVQQDAAVRANVMLLEAWLAKGDSKRLKETALNDSHANLCVAARKCEPNGAISSAWIGPVLYLER